MQRLAGTISYTVAAIVAILFSLCVVMAALLSYMICLPFKIFHKA